jgi:hypothetical protein
MQKPKPKSDALCTGITISTMRAKRCLGCQRHRDVMVVSSDVVASWVTYKPALPSECEMFVPKESP